MTILAFEHGLFLAFVLFLLGLTGLFTRKNIIFQLFSLEIMLNAGGFVFILGGSRYQSVDGQLMYIAILTVAAAEVAIALALVIQLYHRHHSLDLDQSLATTHQNPLIEKHNG